jgi:sarcosine oxidase subunit beta
LQFDNPEEIALVRESVQVFDELAASGADLELRHQGYLFVATTAEGARAQAELVGRQRGWGLTDVELLDAAQARARFPYLARSIHGARFRHGDGWLNPRRLALALAERSGASIHTGEPVTRLLRAGDRITGVLAGDSIVEAGAVVIAAGPFSAQLADQAGLRLPVAPVRRHKLVVPNFPAVPKDAPMTIEYETGAHWRPALNGAFALWTAPSRPEVVVEDPPTSAGFAFGLLNPASDHALARLTPFWRQAWEGPGVDWWLQAGYYDYTPDRRPLLGATQVEGLYLNTGYSGHGVMCSIGGSRTVVDTITSALKASDNPFRPDREMHEREFDVL